MIVVTAGHVDHGKSALLSALTGIHPSRLPEEQQRGMTLDLGYVYLPLEEGKVLGFIDVPGHEKFLSNMLAGLGGIQHALLVVACDDGIMPQTREHLTILHYLNLPTLTVALTKADKVEPAQREVVKQQVAEALSTLGWQDSSFFFTATPTQEGIDALRQHLIDLIPIQQSPSGPFRLAIDRAFILKGSGLVVTGTALSGQVNVGDTLWLTRLNQPVRVRSLRSQNQPVELAHAGERVALNISGDVERAEIHRGDWLLQYAPPQPVERVIVDLHENQPLLKHWQPVHCHHAASHVTGRLSLLESPEVSPQRRVAELILDKPLYLTLQDRLIIRDISARHTLAAASVLQLTVPKRGKRQPDYLNWLNALTQASDPKQRLALYLQEGAHSFQQLTWQMQCLPAELDAWLSELSILKVQDHILYQRTARDYQQRLIEVLEEEHAQHPDQIGVGRARLQRMALPKVPASLVFALIDQLIQQGDIEQSRGWIHLPQHRAHFDESQERLWQQLLPHLGLEAYWVRELAERVQQDEDTVRTLLKKAAQLGYVTAIIRDRYFLTERLLEIAALVRSLQQTQGFTRVVDFRDQLGVGRKLAIQVLEYFDRCGFTRRKGNERVMRDEGLFFPPPS